MVAVRDDISAESQAAVERLVMPWSEIGHH